jgi:hypothetical protein
MRGERPRRRRSEQAAQSRFGRQTGLPELLRGLLADGEVVVTELLQPPGDLLFRRRRLGRRIGRESTGSEQSDDGQQFPGGRHGNLLGQDGALRDSES